MQLRGEQYDLLFKCAICLQRRRELLLHRGQAIVEVLDEGLDGRHRCNVSIPDRVLHRPEVLELKDQVETVTDSSATMHVR